MSSIRPSGQELVPVGWVQTPGNDSLQFTHRDTGLCIEAVETGPSSRPGVDCSDRWTVGFEKSVGETGKKMRIGHASTKENARRTLYDWMDLVTEMSERSDWDEAVALGTVADKLECNETDLDEPNCQDNGW